MATAALRSTHAPGIRLPARIATRTSTVLAAAPFRRAARRTTIAMAASDNAPAVEVWVKGVPETNTLLDCAFLLCVVVEWMGCPGVRTCGGERLTTRAHAVLCFFCFFFFPSCFPSSSLPVTHTHTHTHTGPFCHRTLLTLETKAVPYKRDYIDFAAKPAW
jgi:hypothetical protein